MTDSTYSSSVLRDELYKYKSKGNIDFMQTESARDELTEEELLPFVKLLFAVQEYK